MANDSVKTSSRARTKKALAQVVISAMMLAVAVLCKFVSALIPFNLPYGGSITIILVPLCLVGLLCGPIWGTAVSVAFSLINFLWDGVSSWTPNTNAVILTLFLDYIIAFGVIGLASVFRRSFFQKNPYAPLLAVLVTGLLRLVSHFFSGVIVWNNLWDYSGPIQMDWSGAGVKYSLAYNCSYMIPTILLSLLVMMFLLKPLYTLFDMPIFQSLSPKAKEGEEQNKTYQIPTYRTLSYIFAGIFLILAVLSLVPVLKMNWLGYFAAPLCLASLVYEIVLLVRGLKKGETDWRTILMLVVFLLLLALAIVGIVSRYTYGIASYPTTNE